MDFRLTEEQELLRDTARAMLARECPPALLRAHLDDPAAADPLWEHLAGFCELGTGAATDLCLFLDETGFVAAPGPFLAAVALATPLLAAAGHDLAGTVAAGDTTATVALAGADGRWVPNDEPVKTFVLEADRVDHLVVVATGPSVAVAPTASLPSPRLVETVDGSRRVFEVDTSDVADATLLAPDALAAWLDRAHVALAAETVGTARRCFEMALAYAKEREQFDRPIGSFQAIQHKLAEMALEVERATAAVHYAAMTVDADDPDRTRAAHVAQAAAGAAARRCLEESIQIHGGIGYTWEHDLHLFLRRATADEHLLGTTRAHHDALADALFSA